MIRYLMIPVLLQALLIIHVIRTGRNTSWIYLLIFLPFAGGIAYLAVEVLPELLNPRRLRRHAEAVGGIVNPGGRIRRMEEAACFSPTFKNLVALADAYLDGGRFNEAAVTYKGALKPPFEQDTDILYRFAFAQYKSGRFEDAESTMSKIGELGRGRFKAQEILLHAKIREGQGDQQNALRLYGAAASKSADLSYRFYYGQYLRRIGRIDDARVQYRDIRERMEHIPRAMKKQYRSMLGELRTEMAELESGKA